MGGLYRFFAASPVLFSVAVESKFDAVPSGNPPKPTDEETDRMKPAKMLRVLFSEWVCQDLTKIEI